MDQFWVLYVSLHHCFKYVVIEFSIFMSGNLCVCIFVTLCIVTISHNYIYHVLCTISLLFLFLTVYYNQCQEWKDNERGINMNWFLTRNLSVCTWTSVRGESHWNTRTTPACLSQHVIKRTTALDLKPHDLYFTV